MFVSNNIMLIQRPFKSDNTGPDDDDDEEETEKTTWTNFKFSLNKMLKAANMSAQAFIKMTTKLSEMLDVSTELFEHLPRLKSNFNVSSVLFSKYKTMFKDIFNCGSNHSSILTDWDLRNMQGRSKPVDCHESLFKFGWLLFIYIKSLLQIYLLYLNKLHVLNLL